MALLAPEGAQTCDPKDSHISDNARQRHEPTLSPVCRLVVSWLNDNSPLTVTGFDRSDYLVASRIDYRDVVGESVSCVELVIRICQQRSVSRLCRIVCFPLAVQARRPRNPKLVRPSKETPTRWCLPEAESVCNNFPLFDSSVRSRG